MMLDLPAKWAFGLILYWNGYPVQSYLVLDKTEACNFVGVGVKL